MAIGRAQVLQAEIAMLTARRETQLRPNDSQAAALYRTEKQAFDVAQTDYEIALKQEELNNLDK